MKFKLKNIVLASVLGLSCLLGICAGLANNVYGKGAEAVEKRNYWLLGSGSFTTETWTKSGGIQMEASSDSGNNAELIAVHLTAGDVFKIVDNSSNYYGWEKYQSGGSYFRTAYYDYYDSGSWKNYNSGDGDTTADGKHTYYVNHGSYYLWKMYIWNGGTNNGWPGASNSSQPGGAGTRLYGFNNGRYLNSTTTATDVIFSNNGSDSDRTQTKFTSNGNIVVATTGYYNIYLSKDNNKIYITKNNSPTITHTYYTVVDGVLQSDLGSKDIAGTGGSKFSTMTASFYGTSFDGWYSDSSCSTSIDDDIMYHPQTIYAKFTRLSTNRTYYIDVTSCVSQFNNYMYVYYWGPNSKNSGEPGILLTAISGISNFYSFSIPSDATGFLVRLNNNNNYQRTVDITPSAEHNLYVINTNYGSGSSNKQSGVWQDVIYYLIGNETFTGNADTAWRTEGGKVMHEPTTDNGNAAEITGVTIPTNPSGHSCGVNIVMIYANAAGELQSYYYHSLGQSYSFCREYQDVAAGDQGINIYFDNAGGTQFGGTYSFYLKNGSVYVVDDSNKESYGYIYLSCAGSADEIRVTSSKNGASTPNINNVRLSTVTDTQTVSSVTFNSVRNLHKIPVYNLRGNDVSQYIKTVVIAYGGSSTTYILSDNDDEPNYYFNYGNSSINEDADIAYAAELAFEFGKAVSGAGNKSVCNITEGTAKQLCNNYDSFIGSHSSAAASFTGATINTWDSAKPTYEGDAAFSMNTILYQISKIAADGTNRGSLGRFGNFSLFGSEDNFSTIIIIISSSVALLSVTALSILVIRKRKSKEQ